MVKVVYFDYHGVLDRRNFRGLLETMGRSWSWERSKDRELYVPEFLEQEGEIGYSYATGVLTPHQYWRHIVETYGPEVERAGRQYLLHVEPVREMWNLVSQLKTRFEVGLFSDCSLDKKEVLRSAYALTDYFDYLILSCDVRMSKQETQFYQLMLQSGKYRPEECVLIDDGIENTERAINLGFQAYIHRDVATTQAYLESLAV